MKKFLLFALIMVSLAPIVFVMTGCSGLSPRTPQSVRQESNYLRWDSGTNADSHLVQIRFPNSTRPNEYPFWNWHDRRVWVDGFEIDLTNIYSDFTFTWLGVSEVGEVQGRFDSMFAPELFTRWEYLGDETVRMHLDVPDGSQVLVKSMRDTRRGRMWSGPSDIITVQIPD